MLGGILREARLPGWTVDNTKSFVNVKASAFVRMDEQLTVFSVRCFSSCFKMICVAVICAASFAVVKLPLGVVWRMGWGWQCLGGDRQKPPSLPS